jgi:hypothetical protein
MKGVLGSVSCKRGLNWTLCLCDTDNCNSQDTSVQLLALGETTSTTSTTSTTTTASTSRPITFGPTHKFNTTLTQRVEFVQKETTTRSSNIINTEENFTTSHPNPGVISLLESLVAETSPTPTNTQYLTYRLYQTIATHNLTHKCLSLPSVGQVPLTLKGLRRVTEEAADIRLVDCHIFHNTKEKSWAKGSRSHLDVWCFALVTLGIMKNLWN